MDKRDATSGTQFPINQAGQLVVEPADLLAEPQLQPFGNELVRVNSALQQAAELSAVIQQMQEICRIGNPDTDQQRKFEGLKEAGSTVVAQLQSLQQQSETLRFEINDGQDRQVEIDLQMPRLSEISRTLYTSYAPEQTVDDGTLHNFVHQQRQSSLKRDATIQGVRIFARYPYDPCSSPQRAINSLSCITGTRICMLGNVMHPRVATRSTGIPLGTGEIAICGVNIPASDGTAADLLVSINQLTEQHGVHAVLTEAGRLVLQRLDGAAIHLSVKSQTAAILSGYNMGVQTRPSNSNGIPVWFAQPSVIAAASAASTASTENSTFIEFDSVGTGQALTGKAVASLELNALHWDDLHCRNRSSAQFALVFLELISSQLVSIRKACLGSLRNTIQKLENLAGQCFVTLKNYLQQMQHAILSVA